MRVASEATGVLHDTITDSQGRYRFPYLPVGKYDVKAEAAWFCHPTDQEVNLSAGSAFAVQLVLLIGVFEVDPVSISPVLDTERSEVAADIRREEVDELPFLGRNFLDLALLAPGVSATNTAATQPLRRDIGSGWSGPVDQQSA